MRINTFFLNPFYMYSLSWIVAIFLYELEIIKAFPKLSNSLLLFLLISIFYNLVLGKVINSCIKINTNNITFRYDYFIFFILSILWIVIFTAEGKIPLLEILKKTGYIYSNFKGLKIITGITFQLTYYFLVYFYSKYLLLKKKRYILFIGILFLMLVLVYKRGPILLIMISYVILNVSLVFKKRKLLLGVLATIILLFLFGIFGNIRHGARPLDTSMLKGIVNMNNSSKRKIDPFLWGYTYATSPLSNLQYNISINNRQSSFKNFLLDDIVPLSISKRIFAERKSNYKLLIKNLTVGTIYSKSYVNFNLLGMYMLMFFYSIYNLIVIKIIKNKHEIKIVSLTLLTLLNIFSIFDNMYNQSNFGQIIIIICILLILKKIIKLGSDKNVKV